MIGFGVHILNHIVRYVLAQFQIATVTGLAENLQQKVAFV